MKKLVSTLNMERDTWLAYRKRGIGGSDAAAVAGLNPYSSPIKVFYDKTTDKTPDSDNEAMRLGRDLENYVAQRFCEATGFKVRRSNAIYYDEKRPFMIGDADRLIVGQKAGLECKTVNIYSTSKWDDGQTPIHYLMQCYHYMSVFNVREWYITALIFGQGIVIRKLTWDDDIINSLRSIEQNFWTNYVQKNIVPSPDGSRISDSIISDRFKLSTPGAAVTLEGFDERLARRNELLKQISEMETEKSKIEQEVKLAMGECELATCDGFQITWKNTSSCRLDTERIKREEPDIYNRFVKSSSSRRLIIKAT